MRRSTRVSAGLAVLLVLATGSALFSSPERVAASDGTVTTVLQPGWNLAGWTEAEASIEAIFDDIPQLEIAYDWDAESQRFRLATRTDEGAQGDLTTLSPGMGLWLWLRGDESFTWSRPLVPRAADTPLHEGWNLAVWVGGEDVAAREALLDIEHILMTARDAGGRELGSLRRGDTLWLRVSAPREWWQPPVEPLVYELPRIEFSGDFSPEEQATLRADVEDVVAYFARRFDVGVSDLTIRYIQESTSGGGLSKCGDYAVRRVRLLGEECFGFLAHEYAHAIQDKIGHTYPRWLAEGVANRWDHQYKAHTGTLTYDEHFAHMVVPRSQTIEVPLLTHWNKGPLYQYTPEAYFLAQLGTEFLVDSAGERSLYNFFALLTRREDWTSTFLEAFGIGIYQFSESFEEYREKIAPMFRRLSGTIVSADSKPVGDVLVHVYTIEEEARSLVWEEQALSGFDGSFSVVTPGGSVALEVNCPHSGGGWYAGDGLSLDPKDVAPVIIDRGGSPGIVIRLPVTQEEALRVPCSSSTLVEYTVLGSNGEPLPRIEMVFIQGRPDGGVTSQERTTAPGGMVAFPVGLPSGVWITIDPETKCPAPRAYEGSVLLGRVDIGGGFSPSQYWTPPNTTFVGVEAENVGDRTIMINFPEDCI
ncbi:MAG: hypothetical protein OXG61_12790 [Chloroflexi bacterium]|nr:hypothetical protein [Chloroflexota bacterium]